MAGSGPLHQATSGDFDIQESNLLGEILGLVDAVAQGAQTIAERNQSGEIRAPRVVRSV